VFPFPWYKNVTREDILAIKAYLFSVMLVYAPNKPPDFAFSFNVRETLLTWRTLFFKEGKPPASAPKSEDNLARGAYLVEGLGRCGECHNHYDVLGASDWSGKFEGARSKVGTRSTSPPTGARAWAPGPRRKLRNS